MRALAGAVLLAALILLGSPAAAQEPETPEALALAYMDALRASDWTRVTGLMHPDALREFKEMFAPLVAGGDPQLAALFGVADTAAFRATPPDSAFAGFLASVMGAANLTEMLANAQIQVIGGVQERGTDVTHVLYRMTMDMQGVTATQMDVMPVRQDGGHWRALLSGDIEGIAAMMKREMERASPPL